MIRALSSFRVQAAIRFFPRLSESISDLVRRAESNEVVGFIGGKGVGGDAKDFVDFRAITGLDFPHERLGGTKLFGSARIHEHQHRRHGASVHHDIIIEIRKGAAHGCHIVDQDVLPSTSDQARRPET